MTMIWIWLAYGWIWIWIHGMYVQYTIIYNIYVGIDSLLLITSQQTPSQPTFSYGPIYFCWSKLLALQSLASWPRWFRQIYTKQVDHRHDNLPQHPAPLHSTSHFQWGCYFSPGEVVHESGTFIVMKHRGCDNEKKKGFHGKHTHIGSEKESTLHV